MTYIKTDELTRQKPVKLSVGKLYYVLYRNTKAPKEELCILTHHNNANDVDTFIFISLHHGCRMGELAFNLDDFAAANADTYRLADGIIVSLCNDNVF